MSHTRIERRTRKAARMLRHRPTDAERKLWLVLRDLRTTRGLHFRRQAPIGPFIADFACLQRKLVIEVDGGQHESLRKGYDEGRTRWLSSQGFTVLRFWNNDVLASPNTIAELIIAAVAPTPDCDPTPDPSPQGGGEQSARGEAFSKPAVAVAGTEVKLVNKPIRTKG
jgi:very-short-patch-repair endonuclease